VNTVKQVSRRNVEATDPFLHVIRNLYVVPTPLVNGLTESKIEDFFDAATKAIKLDGKTFNPKEDRDKVTE